MSDKHNCPRCNAPVWYLIGVNTPKFECGSYSQFPSMACRYASQLQERIKRLEEAGDEMHISCSDRLARRIWTAAKEAKP